MDASSNTSSNGVATPAANTNTQAPAERPYQALQAVGSYFDKKSNSIKTKYTSFADAWPNRDSNGNIESFRIVPYQVANTVQKEVKSQSTNAQGQVVEYTKIITTTDDFIIKAPLPVNGS
tara:strand:+ start:184 stop:543 length:360 start_codon:yes stop_codon:yes gene_type:complete